MLAAVRGPYDLAQQQADQRMAGARTQATADRGIYDTAASGENALVLRAIAERAAAIKALMAQASQERALFTQGAQTDLNAQGANLGAYGAANALEANRLGAQGTATNLYGADLDMLAKQQNAQRSAYGAQATADTLSNIQASHDTLLQQLALQRAQDEAKIRAQAAQAGVKL